MSYHFNDSFQLNVETLVQGLVEGGSYIVSGFIISACITLDDGWLSILFYFAGECALMAYSSLYQMS
eukprot:COSAG02_NODE_4699_length_5081_cov_2.268165_4_plen_66_part_01